MGPGRSVVTEVLGRIARFAARHPWLGPLLWVSSLQYLVAQFVVAAAWPVPFSLKNNYISDLGNTSCTLYDGLYVCSPLHLLMNLSFVVFGVTIAAGSVLIFSQLRRTKATVFGFSLMALSGIGTVMVGLFPENGSNSLHTVGAVLGLVVGNVSIVVLGLVVREMSHWFRVYSVVSGVVCLVAFVLFLAEIYVGIGRGGMERLVSYPFTVWMILHGVSLLRRHRDTTTTNVS